MPRIGRMAAGSVVGAAVVALLAPHLKQFFSAPDGGVGVLTVHGYPKGWDYFVVAALVVCAFGGALVSGVRDQVSGTFRPGDTPRTTATRYRITIALALFVFVSMLFIHDNPFVHMDPFHEGEHLTPAWLFLNGERPYGEVFLLHGLGVDGGLDALVGGRLPHTRRLQTFLDAAALALLVPIAAELTVTTAGLVAAVLLPLCGIAAFWIPVFPYFRLAPLLLAVWAMLRYARVRQPHMLLVAYLSASLGVLWSLDVGTYALGGVAAATLILRPPWRRVLLFGAIAAAAPLVILLAVRADVRQFFVDSYVIVPSAIDAVWALPAPEPFTANGLRYYVPPVFYGFLLALAVKRRDPRIAIVAIFSILLFRTAAGRVSWSHTRFAVPLLGVAFVAFVLEPLRSRIAVAVLAIASVFYFEVPQNLGAGAKLASQWAARQRHDGLVPHPLARGIYTTEDNATQLATLKQYVDSLGPGTIFDFSNERALYMMLKRKPAARCFDVPMLSAPALLAETMTALRKEPPVAVILGGDPVIAVFDGVPNPQRVPRLAAWIDAHYPKRTEIGRFTVATR
ncbi:MAG TPA: hypothetical protein VGF28_16165 [Thermoanaerobaculia bacterium]|jgi:hypothetical protein